MTSENLGVLQTTPLKRSFVPETRVIRVQFMKIVFLITYEGVLTILSSIIDSRIVTLLTLFTKRYARIVWLDHGTPII